ncbi:MAG: hypothetical protein C5S49_02070 [Candidatus Methanogaster sp.]|nr:MAG: hypothetical protein C5S49_02070 [ANME-2 cluster archaeon]
MKNRLITGAMIVAVVVAAAISGGCVENNEIEVADADQVRGYADPITEKILLAMNDDYYTRYSEDFDQTMKNAMPEAVFNDTNAMITSKIGDYVSKEFWKTERKDNYTIVHYKAEFTDEPADVTIRVVFQEINGEMKVSGLRFDSPELR